MTTTDADLVERGRLAIELELVTRRGVTPEGERIHRLRVADRTGAQFAVLIAPGSDPLLDLETGARYWFDRLLGAAPVDETVHDDWTCPDCGGGLRYGQIVDVAGPGMRGAVAQLGLDEPFGIVDAGTAVWRANPDRRPPERPHADRPSRTVPDFVCVSCGRHAMRGAVDESATPAGECE